MHAAVVRYLDGRLIKGFAEELSGTEDTVRVKPADNPSAAEVNIPLEELKAIFYVRSLEGDDQYHEKKKYGLRERLTRKVIIRFKDGEFLVGFIQGEVPWDKGFFLSPGRSGTGFYLVPSDDHSNNIKVFVIASAVSNVTTP